MKFRIPLFSIFAFLISIVSLNAQTELDNYLNNYTYDSRLNMKISSAQITELLVTNQAVLVDIRFAEEQEAWSMDYALKIPLDQLPSNLSQLPKDKRIVTACPHKDRAIIAMVYLISKGYDVAYLEDGLLGLADYLRGDRAKEFINKLNN